MKDQLHLLSDQLDDLKKEISHKSSLLDLETENHTRTKEKVKDLTNEMTDLKSKLNEATLNNIDLQSTINNLKLEMEGLNQRIENLVSLNEQLKTSLSQVNSKYRFIDFQIGHTKFKREGNEFRKNYSQFAK